MKKKLYIYYLSEAALWGRDIIWDQNNKHNLWLRNCLASLYHCVNKNDSSRNKLELFYKRVLFANGIHHHYSTDKFQPDFTIDELSNWIKDLSDEQIIALSCDSAQELTKKLTKLLFDVDYISKRVCQDEDKDLIIHSANNFYSEVSQEEVESFYHSIINKDDAKPISYGLNSRLIKCNGSVKEEVYCAEGIYAATINKIIFWLKKAAEVCENNQQKLLIETLCEYYQTGDLSLFDAYSIEWLKEQVGAFKESS